MTERTNNMFNKDNENSNKALQELGSVHFFFENCEYLEIEGKYIGTFYITDITKEYTDSIQYDVAKTIVIEIHRDANTQYQFYGMNSTVPKFTRIQQGDIVSIDFSYVWNDKLGHKENWFNVHPDWVEKKTNINDLQHTYISNEGNLYLVISPDKDVYHHFDMDLINDEGYTEHHWALKLH